VSYFRLPTQNVTVRPRFVRTVRPAKPVARAADAALLRAALGLPPGVDPVVRTSADRSTYDPRPTTEEKIP
jgi:hypothetical protein